MATTRKSKSIAPPIPVPQNREECQRQIVELGNAQRMHATLTAELQDKATELAAQYAESLSKLGDEIKRLHDGIQVWATAHRMELTQGKTKTVNLIVGEICWRDRPPSVTVRKPEQVIQSLKDLGLKSYVRSTEEVNKQALLELRRAGDVIDADEDRATRPVSEQDAVTASHLRLIGGIGGIVFNVGIEDFAVTPIEISTITPAVN